MRDFGIILLSHGKYALEALNSCQMICGELEGIIALSLDANDSKDSFREKFNRAYESLYEDYDRIICLCDIYGGTPFNVLLESLLSSKDFIAYTGFNLPILIELAFSDELDDEDLKSLVERVHNSSLININEAVKEKAEEECEEDFDL